MSKITILVLLLLLPFSARAEPPKVVASIAPLAGIAAAVMDGVGVPELLVQGNASPHTYQMRPSEAQKLAAADLVLWIGPTFESFMKKSVPDDKSMALLEGDPDLQPEGKEITLLHAAQEEHEESHDHDHHGHGFYDPHLWLNPFNAVAIARQLADRLTQLDPTNAKRYQNNALAFGNELAGWDADINTNLSKVKDKPFIVFHDAYQYFVKRYALSFAGAISLSPEVPPSAQQLAHLQAEIKEKDVVCVFAEPQFRAAVVDTLVKGTSARKGLLNPDASDLPVTPQLYVQYLQRLAQNFSDCLQEPVAQQ
jgi:zinc transport system substrate-binding protein